MRKIHPLSIPQILLCLLALCLTIFLAACGATASPPTTAANTPTSAPTTVGNTPAGLPTSAANTPTSAPTTATSRIAITGFAFSSKTLTVKVGTKVTWTNDDPAIHTVTADNGAFGSASLPPGGTFSFTFTKAGTYSYHCKIHAAMKATIVVQ